MKPKKLFLIAAGVFAAALAIGCDPTSGSTSTQAQNTKPEWSASTDSPSATSSFTPADPAAAAKRAEAESKEEEEQAKPGPAGSTAAPGATPPKAGEQVGVIDTNLGRIIVKFFPSKAPNTVKNFVSLANKKFYDGTKFHRVIPGFMIQGGDPFSKTGAGPVGTGDSGHNIKAEFNDTHHSRGILSMARSQDPDSASCQFFITVADAGHLDGQYTAFGQVARGMDVVDKIVNLPRDANDRPTPKEAVMKNVRIMKWPVK